MARKIVVASGKGGVGKTSVTAGIGISLASRGESVLLIDADVGLNNLDVVLGMERRIVYDMTDVLSGKCNIRRALLQDEYVRNLYLLPSAHAYASDGIDAAQFRRLLNRLDGSFSYILIDCPAGIDQGFHRAVCGADEAIVVTTPHIAAIRDADKTLALLSGYGLHAVSLVLNRVRGDLIMRHSMMPPQEIARLLRYPLLGVVPEDDRVTVYSQVGRMAMQVSQARQSFDMIADNIASGTRKLYDPTQRYRGVLGKLKIWWEAGL